MEATAAADFLPHHPGGPVTGSVLRHRGYFNTGPAGPDSLCHHLLTLPGLQPGIGIYRPPAPPGLYPASQLPDTGRYRGDYTADSCQRWSIERTGHPADRFSCNRQCTVARPHGLSVCRGGYHGRHGGTGLQHPGNPGAQDNRLHPDGPAGHCTFRDRRTDVPADTANP